MKRFVLLYALIVCWVTGYPQLSEKTYNRYATTIEKTLRTQPDRVKQVTGPIEEIIRHGSQDQRMWLALVLQRVNINEVPEGKRWNYLYWTKLMVEQLCLNDTFFVHLAASPADRRALWMNFYSGRGDTYDQAFSLLNNLTTLIQMCDLAGMQEAMWPAMHEQLGMRSHYIEYCLTGSDRYATEVLGTGMQPRKLDRLADLLGSREFIANPMRFRPLMEALLPSRAEEAWALHREIVEYGFYYLSSPDQTAVNEKIKQLTAYLKFEVNWTDSLYLAIQHCIGKTYQLAQTNTEMMRLHNETNTEIVSRFIRMKEELAAQGKAFVQYAPLYCPWELKQDSLYPDYEELYMRVGYAFCQEVNVNGLKFYIQSNTNVIRYMLDVFGYREEMGDWEYRFVQLVCDLYMMSSDMYYLTRAGWAMGAAVLQANILLDMEGMWNYDVIYFTLAKSLRFIYGDLNNKEWAHYIMDNFMLPHMPYLNLHGRNRQLNCDFTDLYADVLPYLLTYDEPRRSELGDFYAERLRRAVQRNRYCPNNPGSLLQLAVYYLNVDKSEDARQCVDEYLALSQDSATYYQYRAWIAAYTGDYAASAAYMDWVNREDPSAMATGFYSHALYPAKFYALARETAKARQQLNLFRNFADDYFRRQLLIAGDEQAANLLDRYSDVSDLLAQMAADSIDESLRLDVVRQFYDWKLLTKGILMSLSSESDAILSRHSLPRVRELHSRLKQQEEQLSAMTDKNGFEAELLRIRISTTRRNLTEVLQDYLDHHDIHHFDQPHWQTVWLSMQPEDAAVEFAAGTLAEDTLPTYYALLLRRCDTMMTAVPLFREEELRQLVEGRNERQLYNIEEANMALAHLIFDALVPYLRDGQTVYFAPDGMLHQIPLENLQWTEDSLLSQKYDLHRLSSTRQLALMSDRDDLSPRDSVVLYGGIVYDAAAGELLAESRLYPEQQLASARATTKEDIDRGRAGYLPGAEQEVREIDRLLSDARQPHLLRMGVQANEESFKALDLSDAAMLHIATHGFFWDNDAAVNYRYFRSGLSEEQALQTIDPMRRCGLLMAGSNIALSGHASELPEGVQDGVLTAQEIALMNLSRTKLVILSACETGVGEVNSDGVFGLQRAFKKAGVESLVMSLWKVSDSATRLLMTEFYKNWLLLRQSRHDAFRHAQQAVRRRYEEPVYWAGFIIMD